MKKTVFFRAASCLLAMALLFSSALAAGDVLYKGGSSGEEIVTVKTRLVELGYLQDSKLTKKLNSSAQKALRVFQEQNGLDVTGVLTQGDLDALYSDAAKPYAAPTPTPRPTLAPEYVPPAREFRPDDLPTRDAEGYLAAEGEYFYENDDEGQWAYLTRNLQIIINRYSDESIPLVWFETELFLRGGEKLLTVENNPERPGTRFSAPFDIATENRFVLGFTDDFYGHRFYRKQTGGIVIRNGEILSSKTYNKRLHSLPNLDMLAQFPDGSLKTYYCGSITAEELLALGAENVFCFGPVVIQDGLADELVMEGYYDTKSPRQLLGMIAPNHYLLVTVQGRMEDSAGSGLRKPCLIMLARGVTEGFNLDGGNTMALVFRGRMLNNLAQWKNKKFVRSVSSLIGVGQSDSAVPETQAE